MTNKKITPHELAEMTVKDIEAKRKRVDEGHKQACMHVLENRNRIQRKLSHGRY